MHATPSRRSGPTDTNDSQNNDEYYHPTTTEVEIDYDDEQTAFDDTSTWANSTMLAIAPDGTCPHHPHIVLREVGEEDGYVYQKDSCPACDDEFQQQRKSLKQQKKELDRQLEHLKEEQQHNDENGNGNDDGNDYNNTSHGNVDDNYDDAEEEYDDQYDDNKHVTVEDKKKYTHPGHFPVQQQQHHQQQQQQRHQHHHVIHPSSGYGTGSAAATGAPAVAASLPLQRPRMHHAPRGSSAPAALPLQQTRSMPTPTTSTTTTTTMTVEYLTSQMQMMQQVQDWMIREKDSELSLLRTKLDDQQKELIRKEVEIAILKERMEQQEVRMQQELKLLKLAAFQSEKYHLRQKQKKSNGSSSGTSDDGGSGNGGKTKEIHIQELHVQVGSNLPTKADGTVDPQYIQAATQAATTAALENAMKQYEMDQRAHHQKNQQQQPQKQQPQPQLQLQQSSSPPLQQQKQKQQNQHMASMTTITTGTATTSTTESDRTISKGTVGSIASTAVLSSQEKVDSPTDHANHRSQTKHNSDDSDDDVVDDDDVFDTSTPWASPGKGTAAKVASSRKKKKTVSSTTKTTSASHNTTKQSQPSHPNPNRKDPLEAPIRSLPSGSNKMTNTSGGIPLDLHLEDDGPPMVPLKEDVTLGTLDASDFQSLHPPHRLLNPQPINRSGSDDDENSRNPLPRGDGEDSDDDDSLDNTSVGNTVASSTYGDDRQKVVSQLLLDPYGDSGRYSGVILRSTGMPHGLGRMVYEDDGRTYEGDWRHGRWHGFGKATFANADSYEGEYRFDQRHGRGKYCWSDGRIYDGEFSEDKRHGKGTFEWPDGATYTGDFNNGQREGHGRYTFSDGGYYVGSWIDGRYDGFGGTLTLLGCLLCSISHPFLGHSHAVRIHSHTCCILCATLFFME
jgi:hypothetical protein